LEIAPTRRDATRLRKALVAERISIRRRTKPVAIEIVNVTGLRNTQPGQFAEQNCVSLFVTEKVIAMFVATT
jgi:hypothetical protein